MKKLMFAALAVAGMSAVAAEFTPVVAEKLQISVKSAEANSDKIATTKINGYVFTDAQGNQQVYTWTKALNTNEPDGLTYEWKTADGKSIKTKAGKLYDLTSLGREQAFECRFDSTKKVGKVGKAIAFAGINEGLREWYGYGSGSATIKAAADPAGKMKIVDTKESISGNIVTYLKDGGRYGTWKMSLDKSMTKNLAEKGWTIKDVLGKNKVEFWDTNR